MKSRIGVVLVAAMVVSNVYSQINLNSSSINFRTNTTAGNSTYHYGDLHLEGGTSGSSWGWLYCNLINNNGNSYLYGPAYFYSGLNVLSGTKNFIQMHPSDSTKVIKYIAIEAGEAITLARGLSKTVSGSVDIILPEHFALVTSSDAPLTVLLTPENAPVTMYTSSKTKEHVTVVMKHSDYEEYGDATFAWQINGVRDGYENEQIICDTDSLLEGLNNPSSMSEKRKKMDNWAKKEMKKSKKLK
ncbi:MAG: hypothetical protein JXA91_07720 [Candidatus Thermoplasmatota archaeon]|nr:hypothetical protein [Candidatus Thermoplasmatota archaeon]